MADISAWSLSNGIKKNGASTEEKPQISITVGGKSIMLSTRMPSLSTGAQATNRLDNAPSSGYIKAEEADSRRQDRDFGSAQLDAHDKKLYAIVKRYVYSQRQVKPVLGMYNGEQVKSRYRTTTALSFYDHDRVQEKNTRTCCRAAPCVAYKHTVNSRAKSIERKAEVARVRPPRQSSWVAARPVTPTAYRWTVVDVSKSIARPPSSSPTKSSPAGVTKAPSQASKPVISSALGQSIETNLNSLTRPLSGSRSQVANAVGQASAVNSRAVAPKQAVSNVPDTTSDDSRTLQEAVQALRNVLEQTHLKQ